MAIKTDAQLQAYADANINTNGSNSITGALHNTMLTDMIDSKLNVADYVDTAANTTTVKVSLDATDVAGLGSETELIPAPGAGLEIQLISCNFKLNVTTQLEVGSQSLEIAQRGTASGFFAVTTASLEAAAGVSLQLATKINAETGEDSSIVAYLSGSSNPSSGSATMDFYITYKILTL